jgi:hypothetical protein
VKVKCIDARDSNSELELNHIYEVLEEFVSKYHIRSNDGRTYRWLKSRFEVVEAADGTKITGYNVVSVPTIKQAPASKKVDAEEEKCWKALSPKDPEGFCKCGTHKSVCWIHKD